MRFRVVVVVLSALLVAACGGSHASKPRTSTAEEGGPGALPADSVAWVEIARASGVLRAGVAATALGKAQRIGERAAQRVAAQQLGKLRANDRGLAALRITMRSALLAALGAARDPGSQRRAARAALSATDTINRGLHRYAARHPELRALIPD